MRIPRRRTSLAAFLHRLPASHTCNWSVVDAVGAQCVYCYKLAAWWGPWGLVWRAGSGLSSGSATQGRCLIRVCMPQATDHGSTRSRWRWCR